MKSVKLALILLTISQVLAACAVQQAKIDLGGETTVVHCTADSECLEGTTCDGDLKVCVSQATNKLQVDVQLTPPIGESVGKQQLIGFQINDANAIDLKMQEQVTVTGLVSIADQTGGQRAKIVATAKGVIKGTSYRFETTSTKSTDRNAPNFTLKLNANLEYDISVTLLDSDRPSYRAKHRFDANSVESSLKMNIAFPSTDGYWLIAGRLLKADGEPASQIKIQAYEPGGVRSSTIDTTKSDGAFELQVWPSAGVYMVRLFSQGGQVQIPVLDLQKVEISGTSTVVGAIVSPELSAFVDVKYRVLGRDTTGVPAAVANTSVTFSAQLLGGKISTTLLTDAQGYVTVKLLAGTYLVTVVPALDGVHAISQQHVTLGAATEQRFERILQPKPLVTGKILGPEGKKALPRTTLSFVLKQSTSSDFPVVEGREFTTVTDSSGNYRIALDPGFYSVLIAPSKSSGLARKVYKSIAVEQTGPLPELKVETAAVLTGRVKDDTGKPLKDVTVEVYDHSNETAFILAFGKTDSKGVFKLLVPHQAK